jgi:hypothetical protein
MPQSSDAPWVRNIKWAVIAAALALGFGSGAHFLQGPLRSIALGAATSLALCAVASLADGYLRERPLDTSRAAVDAKARRTRRICAMFGAPIFVVIPIIDILIDRLNLGWTLCGLIVGAFGFIALRFGPVFYAIAQNSRSTPLPGTTSMERATRAPMEPSRHQDFQYPASRSSPKPETRRAANS